MGTAGSFSIHNGDCEAVVASVGYVRGAVSGSLCRCRGETKCPHLGHLLVVEGHGRLGLLYD